MYDKLDAMLSRYRELEKLTQDPEIAQNIALYQTYAKEMSALRNVAGKYGEIEKLRKEISSLKEDIRKHEDEPELKDMIEDEIAKLEARITRLDEELEDMLFEKDSGSGRNIIMEIRAGTGGVEAALFAGDLFRMYSKYFAKKGWAIDVISNSNTEKGGIKEIIFSVTGTGVYGRMKYESGTHRVQRVPETEASGRIHTSAATVAVLPEAEEVDIKINPQDLKIDTFRASGAGGQHVNRTESAIRITHIPTGTVVQCQDDRSQHKNKAKAMRVLRTRIYESFQDEHNRKISKERKVQVGSGDRSEKIRTYNFPDGRVTDHRIGLTLHKIEDIMEGDLDEIMDALKAEERRIRRGGK